jgi:DNA end-binding protein Ku
MPARAIDSATLSFGLVAIPVKIYTTSEPSHELHFNLIHEGCGERLKQRYVCPEHGEVERADMAKGFELTKGNFVELEKDELKALEAVATDEIGLSEFVPATAVDPLYIDRSYYLGPDKGGERAYRLFRDALADAELVGIASYSARGKQYIVMVRPYEDGLLMHQLRYPDEVKAWSEVPLPKLPAPAPTELALAQRVIEQLRHTEFDPTQYTDEVKKRVRKLIAEKAKGGEIVAPEHEAPAPITDLMAALKASLGGGDDRKATQSKRGHATKRKAAARPHTTRAKHAARTTRTPRKHAASTARGHRKSVRRTAKSSHAK